MATATKQVHSARHAAPTVSGAKLGAVAERRGEYRCECGHILRVFGRGRHRVYFERDNTTLDEPVMNRVCPQCGRGLPGWDQS